MISGDLVKIRKYTTMWVFEGLGLMASVAKWDNEDLHDLPPPTTSFANHRAHIPQWLF